MKRRNFLRGILAGALLSFESIVPPIQTKLERKGSEDYSYFFYVSRENKFLCIPFKDISNVKLDDDDVILKVRKL